MPRSESGGLKSPADAASGDAASGNEVTGDGAPATETEATEPPPRRRSRPLLFHCDLLQHNFGQLG